MNQAEELIKKFKETEPPENGEESEKSDIILEMEDLEDPIILQFFLQVAEDKTEDDLARIEILKIFEVRDNEDKAETEEISKTISSILLAEDDDEDVRNYAAMAASNYMENTEVFSVIQKILLNPDEESDLRWNAFAAIKTYGKTEQSIEIIEKLDDPEFEKAKGRLKQDWSI